jgi:hypothetical protein
MATPCIRRAWRRPCSPSGAGGGVVLAVDDARPLAEEEMKHTVDVTGRVTQISRLLAPAFADGEYIGATFVELPAGVALCGGAGARLGASTAALWPWVGSIE